MKSVSSYKPAHFCVGSMFLMMNWNHFLKIGLLQCLCQMIIIKKTLVSCVKFNPELANVLYSIFLSGNMKFGVCFSIV